MVDKFLLTKPLKTHFLYRCLELGEHCKSIRAASLQRTLERIAALLCHILRDYLDVYLLIDVGQRGVAARLSTSKIAAKEISADRYPLNLLRSRRVLDC